MMTIALPSFPVPPMGSLSTANREKDTSDIFAPQGLLPIQSMFDAYPEGSILAVVDTRCRHPQGNPLHLNLRAVAIALKQAPHSTDAVSRAAAVYA